MKHFAVLIGVTDYQSAKSTLMDFKKNMQGQGEVIVFDLCESNYDFLYNSLIEQANAEEKRRSEP